MGDHLRMVNWFVCKISRGSAYIVHYKIYICNHSLRCERFLNCIILCGSDHRLLDIVFSCILDSLVASQMFVSSSTRSESSHICSMSHLLCLLCNPERIV